MTEKKNVIKHIPLIFAFFFLFNPNIAVIDILPDFIGYLLICASISRLADLNDNIGVAYNVFKRMIFIDLGKWVAVLWIFGMSVPGERNSSLLLWTFVFSVLEMIFLIPAYSKLYDGITHLGYLLPNRSILNGGLKKGVKVFTVIFIIVKSVLCVLPEFADLTNTAYDETINNGFVNLYNYIGIMRAMAFIPILLVGLAWLIYMESYFSSVCGDKLFMKAAAEKYELEVMPKKGMFIRRNFHTLTLLATVALLFTVDIRIESQNITPDFIAAVMFIITFAFLQKHVDTKRSMWVVPSVIYTVVSAVASVFEYYFFEKYYYGAIIRSDLARNTYIIMVALNVMKCVALLYVIFILSRMLERKIFLHTGYVEGHERFDDGEAKLVRSVHSELKKSVNLAFIFLVVYVVSDICYDTLAPHVDFIGLINFVCAGVCVGLFIRAFSTIQAAIDTKYMLE